MTDTLQALETAIQNHIATAYEGNFVESWVLITASQSIEAHDISNYRFVTPESQPFHVDSGLVETGRRIMRDSWDAWDADDE